MSAPDIPAPPPPAPVPTVFDLFTTFALISLYGFGGVLAWSRRMVVEERKWMTPEEFNEAYALCQFLPGPNIVNFSVVFGSRIRGIPGALAALLGLIGVPMAIVTVLGILYWRYGSLDGPQRVLAGVAAAAAGFLIGAVAKMAAPVFRDGLRNGLRGLKPAPFVAIATFVAVGPMRWSLFAVLAVMLPLSLALTWWARR